MRGSSRRRGALRAASALCAALALARPAAAHEADPFAGETPVSDAELELRRGGFEIGGWKFDLRISVRDTVNGFEIQHAVLQLVDGRRAGAFELAKVSHTIAQGPLPASPEPTPALAQSAVQLPAPELAAPAAPPLQGPVLETAGLQTPALQTPAPETASLQTPLPDPLIDQAAAAAAQPEPQAPALATALPGHALASHALLFALINTASDVALQRDVQLEITLDSGGALGHSLQSVFSQASSALLEGQLGAVQP